MGGGVGRGEEDGSGLTMVTVGEGAGLRLIWEEVGVGVGGGVRVGVGRGVPEGGIEGVGDGVGDGAFDEVGDGVTDGEGAGKFVVVDVVVPGLCVVVNIGGGVVLV